jgi:V/A-type H+-transporting ATPase subunit D
VTAALDHAAADRALQLVAEELAITQRRLRALEHRWLPYLERSLREVELSLAEQEREDMVRARWVSSRHGSGTGGSP